MVSATEKKALSFINDGSINWKPVTDNFENVFNDMKENAAEITALARRQTFTITIAVEQAGAYNVMNPGKHLRCRCRSGYAQLGDNVPEKVICKYDGDSLAFTDTEGAGKVRLFRINEDKIIHFIDAIQIEQSSNRRVVYAFTFESAEEEE